MSSDTELTLKKRETLGKGLGALRRDGMVPAVIHDHGKDSIHVMADYGDMLKAFQAAGKHHPMTLTVDGKKYTALVRDAQYRSAKNRLIHIVFQAVNQNEKVEAEIPVELTGDVPALKLSLQVLQNLDAIEVKALPKDLVDVLHIDGAKLAEAGDKVLVSDVMVPKGIEVLSDPEQVVFSAEIPTDQVAEADKALEEQAAADNKTIEAAAEETTSAEAPAANE